MRLFNPLICFSVWSIIQLETGMIASCHQTRPNVLFILVDDLGFNDIGYHAGMGASSVRTPFLDELAESGIKLENYYVHMVCTPTRGALLTGKYDIHTGLQHEVIKPTYAFGLPTHHELLPGRLQECGYGTHMVGKWHLGFMRQDFVPWNRGFETFSGTLLGESDHFTRKMCHRKMCGFDWSTNGSYTNDTFGEYSTHLYTRKAIETLEGRDRSKPFFLYIAHQAPHRPIQSPENYSRPFVRLIRNRKRRIYAGMVLALDTSIRKLVDYLAEDGVLDDTIIVFSTDNGGEPKEGGNNWPLRGRKGTLWEGGVRAVGFVHGKRLNASREVYKGIMHISDWFPTIMNIANCSMGPLNIDGKDQWKALTEGDPPPRNEVLHNIDKDWRLMTTNDNFSEFNTGIRAAIRVGDWKLLTGDPGDSNHVPPPNIPASQPHKSALKAGAKLFNLKDDPNETEDVSELHPDIVKNLVQRLAFHASTAVPSEFRRRSKLANPALRDGFWGPWID